MAEQGQDRTEAPTSRRRAEARQEGQVVRSADLTAAVSLLAAVALTQGMGRDALRALGRHVDETLGGAAVVGPDALDDVRDTLAASVRVLAEAGGPLVLTITAVALAATLGQVGLILTSRPLEPDLGKLSPLKGLANLFSLRAGMRLGQSLMKLALLAGTAAWVVARDLPRLVSLASLESAPLYAATGELVYDLALTLAALLLVLAVLDYAYQRWQHEQDLKMSKQEVKEELKRMEGDPLVKQRRQRVARQLAMHRVQHAVPQADVVVTNPTHYAVALRYDTSTMAAPQVVAKGADFLALRIRQLAALHEVPIVERKDLARALYRTVDVGRTISPEHYHAVAEVLAYVYRLGRRKAG